MRGVVASVAAAGALLIPSSSAPDNAKLQREIVRLRQQLAVTICHVTALERATAVRPAPVDANGAPANMPPQPSAPCASLPESPPAP